MTNDLKQSVTDAIAKMKMENKKDARVHAGWGVAGLVVAGIAALLFPPGGVGTLIIGASLVLGVTQGFCLLRNAGHHKTLRAAEAEAATDASVPGTMARGATHLKTVRTANRWQKGLLALSIGFGAATALAAPALLAMPLFVPLYLTILGGLNISLGVETFNEGAAKTSREIAKEVKADPKPMAVAPAAVPREASLQKPPRTFSTLFNNIFSKKAEESPNKPKQETSVMQPQRDAPAQPKLTK